MTPTEKLVEMGLELPAPMQLPEGFVPPFVSVRIVGNLAYAVQAKSCPFLLYCKHYLRSARFKLAAYMVWA